MPQNNKFNAIGIIPARLESTRLPRKPLLEIAGKPLIQYVWDNAAKSDSLENVLIAADSEEILKACSRFGAKCYLTPTNISSGTDRIAFVYKKLGLSHNIIVNIQCDEPLLKPNLIDKLVASMHNSNADVATIIKKIENPNDLTDSSVVKVTLANDRTALYFSRSPIPHIRNIQIENWLDYHTFWKHIGIYAYTKKALLKFMKLLPSELEIHEKLEQLRLLQSGAKYKCIETDDELIGVDTPEDLEKLKYLLK